MAFVFIATSAILAYLYSKKLDGKTITRGLTGTSGQTLQLQCPEGQTIGFSNPNPSVSRAALVNINAAGTSCDPFFTPGSGQTTTFYNSTAIVDLLAASSSSGLSACEGKNSCTFTVPLPSSTLVSGNTCLSEAATLSLIGTYDCVGYYT
jgi:hypothetical protein